MTREPADCNSSLTSSFPPSSPWPFTDVSHPPPFSWSLPPPQPRRSINALSLLLRMTSYGFFIHRRLFCIPEAFVALFSWSFIARYTRRHEYLIPPFVLFRCSVTFAPLFRNCIKITFAALLFSRRIYLHSFLRIR